MLKETETPKYAIVTTSHITKRQVIVGYQPSTYAAKRAAQRHSRMADQDFHVADDVGAILMTFRNGERVLSCAS